MEKPNDDEKEYLKSVQEEEDCKLNTGIKAIDKTYLFDKRVEVLVEVFDKAIDYIRSHTDLTEEEIKNRINEYIWQIELKEEYPDNPNGRGYVSSLFRILSINITILKREPEKIYEFIRHEMTHMIGETFIKPFFKRSPIMISGYSREENIYGLKSKRENEYFNEAAVEMFVAQDEEYREEKVLDYTINTKQDLNEGIYCLNSNLIHQMLIAQGITEKEFFQGLYDYKKSKQIIGKFKRSTFKKLSSNMDSIFEELNTYYDIEEEIYTLQRENASVDVSKKEEQMREHKSKLEGIVSSSEKMIIDKVLIPKLKKLSSSEKQVLLSEYDKFLISRKRVF